METKYKIHLWVVDEGWKLFEVDRNSKELIEDVMLTIVTLRSSATYTKTLN